MDQTSDYRRRFNNYCNIKPNMSSNYSYSSPSSNYMKGNYDETFSSADLLKIYNKKKEDEKNKK
jgi:hypothetical protein